MNSLQYRTAVKNKVRKRFRGQKRLLCRHAILYPHSIEREYTRVVFEYMALLKKVIIKFLPELKRIIDDSRNPKTMRADASNKKEPPDINLAMSQTAAASEANRLIRQLLSGIKREADRLGFDYDLRKKLGRLANMTQKLSVREWKKVISKTLGINIFEDYYMGQTYGELIPRWIEENVNLITRIPHDALGKMMDIIQQDVRDGRSISAIIKNIQSEYGISKRHARLIARDQTGKLYGRLAKHQQQDAGIDEYIWSGILDNREREAHVEREGKRFKWDNPPEGGHPGEDYQCRCTALPVFDWDNLNLVEDPEDEGDEESGESRYE